MLGLAGPCLGGGNVHAGEWTDVCWSSHADYFEERSEYLELTYSRLNVNMVRATYLVGKPAYALITKLEGVAFDAVTGLGGGPWSIAQSVIYGQGMEAGTALLRNVLEHPQHLATEVGGRTMERGLAALNRNYRRFRRGISALDDAAKLEFRQDQVSVDLMGPAKNSTWPRRTIAPLPSSIPTHWRPCRSRKTPTLERPSSVEWPRWWSSSKSFGSPESTSTTMRLFEPTRAA